MIAYKKLAIAAATLLSFAALSTQAEEKNDLVFSLSVNKSSPEASAFVPTEESLQRLIANRTAGVRPNMFADPFLHLDWEPNISIELNDEQLMESLSI